LISVVDLDGRLRRGLSQEKGQYAYCNDSDGYRGNGPIISHALIKNLEINKIFSSSESRGMPAEAMVFCGACANCCLMTHSITI